MKKRKGNIFRSSGVKSRGSTKRLQLHPEPFPHQAQDDAPKVVTTSLNNLIFTCNTGLWKPTLCYHRQETNEISLGVRVCKLSGYQQPKATSQLHTEGRLLRYQ